MRNSRESMLAALSSMAVLLLDAKVRLLEIEKYGSASPWLRPGAAAHSTSRTRATLLKARMMILRYFSQNVPAEDAEEVGIAGVRTPLGLRKAQKLVDGQAADLPRTLGVGPGVIKHVAVSVLAELAFTQVDHAVKGHVV